MNDRPNFSATSPTVPLPQNGSRTSDPGGAPANIQGVTRVGRRRPAAIAGLVVSVVVGPAVDRVLQAWARPHVCQEGREGCLPRITDANASLRHRPGLRRRLDGLGPASQRALIGSDPPSNFSFSFSRVFLSRFTWSAMPPISSSRQRELLSKRQAGHLFPSSPYSGILYPNRGERNQPSSPTRRMRGRGAKMSSSALPRTFSGHAHVDAILSLASELAARAPSQLLTPLVFTP